MSDFKLEKHRGDTLDFILEDMLDIEGNTLDLTGATVEFQLDEYTLDTEGVKMDPDPPDDSGNLAITVSAELSAKLSRQYYRVGLRFTYTDDRVDTILDGVLVLSDSVISEVPDE